MQERSISKSQEVISVPAIKYYAFWRVSKELFYVQKNFDTFKLPSKTYK